jgi:uncharacterized protein (TIGR00730 family)
MGARPAYQAAAVAMGQAIVRHNMGLVYGGGNVGLMGTIADAVLTAGGEAIGVIPQFLQAKEVAHLGLTQLHVVESMHERKALMTDLSDAFVALPGGYGTFEEFCEILTWAQLKLHQKAFGLLNVEGYYDPLLELFDRAVTEKFLQPELRSIVLESREPDQLLEQLQNYKPPVVEKWLKPEIKT